MVGRLSRLLGPAAAGMATAAAAGVATAALALQTSAASCESGDGASKLMGRTGDGRPVFLRTLSNGPLRVQVMDFGATITSVLAPAADGTVGEVTLGFDELAPYTDGRSPYFGCVAGRFANRIAKGVFSLEGRAYALATNNGPNALHGGDVGFDKQVWVCEEQSGTSLTLALHSPDGQVSPPPSPSPSTASTASPPARLVPPAEHTERPFFARAPTGRRATPARSSRASRTRCRRRPRCASRTPRRPTRRRRST